MLAAASTPQLVDSLPADLPEVVRQAAQGNWPTFLAGEDLRQVLCFIDFGEDALLDFACYFEESVESGYLDDITASSTAILAEIPIGSYEIKDGYRGDLEQVEFYMTLDTPPPPIVLVRGDLRDGHHRSEVARLKGQSIIRAYLVQ